jgi:hypothetical protein
MMRFSRLRKSRLTMALVATAWLPYMTVCCVVSPFGDSSGSKPNCHVLAGVLPAPAEAGTHSGHSGHDRAHHETAAHHGGSENSHDAPPAQACCCDLTGKGAVTVEKTVDFGSQPVIVAAAVVLAEPAFPARPVRSAALVDVHEHGPPLYLINASFLI